MKRCTADGRWWCFLAAEQQAFPPLDLDLKVNTPLESKRFWFPAPRMVSVNPALASASFEHRTALNRSGFCWNSLFSRGRGQHCRGAAHCVAVCRALSCSVPASGEPNPGSLSPEEVYEQGVCWCAAQRVKFQASRNIWGQSCKCLKNWIPQPRFPGVFRSLIPILISVST